MLPERVSVLVPEYVRPPVSLMAPDNVIAPAPLQVSKLVLLSMAPLIARVPPDVLLNVCAPDMAMFAMMVLVLLVAREEIPPVSVIGCVPAIV